MSTHANSWEHTGHVRLHRQKYYAGRFFITICTHEKYPWFGDVSHGIVGLSRAGSIVADEWSKTPRIRPHVELDAWIVMPNHMHGIIVLNADEGVGGGERVGPSQRDDPTKDSINYFRPPDAGSLAMIMNQFKSICTKRIRAAGMADFAWQSLYHDHIIRDENEYRRIRRYILNNPAAWTAKYG